MRNFCFPALLLLPFAVLAQPEVDDAAATLEGSVAHVYKTIGTAELRLHVFRPAGSQDGDRHPAIVYFHGGGWRRGSPQQFAWHCRYLATRGMVAITVEYRVSGRFPVTVRDSVVDALDAMRWVRAHVEDLGIDPKRIAAGGGSAGGHLAACTALLEIPGDVAGASARPDALVLYNPVLVLAPYPGAEAFIQERLISRERMGVDPVELSPYHHIRKDAPPTQIFHGTADRTVPFFTVVEFTRAMEEAGNSCRLQPFEGQAHGFFNFGRSGSAGFLRTLELTDRFLTGLGWLEGEPTVAGFSFR